MLRDLCDVIFDQFVWKLALYASCWLLNIINLCTVKCPSMASGVCRLHHETSVHSVLGVHEFNFPYHGNTSLNHLHNALLEMPTDTTGKQSSNRNEGKYSNQIQVMVPHVICPICKYHRHLKVCQLGMFFLTFFKRRQIVYVFIRWLQFTYMYRCIGQSR